VAATHSQAELQTEQQALQCQVRTIFTGRTTNRAAGATMPFRGGDTLTGRTTNRAAGATMPG